MTKRRNANNSSGSDEKRPETIDGATGNPIDHPARRDIKLSGLRDVRLELAYVYRQMDAGNIPSQEGTRRAYVLKMVHDVIVSAELEKRIQELEDRAAVSGRSEFAALARPTAH